ncbi:DUF2508 family protein [Paenibacillus sp.]|uniref:DUF2508 family protein n=1 Tax=Paenibacillus sp. TaxID=58172 RepID=UPI002D28E162|nr:DUF2508 family protein [Paenibacillus sp.]HZG83295.1 DUF2508 family protein [Paenibacillus sp.]
MRMNWKAWTGGLAKLRMSTKRQEEAPKPAGASLEEQEHLLQDIRTAHREWECARHRLDQALGDDEVDYAIFALETAEKRYGMLLKQAKAMRLSGRSYRPSAAPATKRTLEG